MRRVCVQSAVEKNLARFYFSTQVRAFSLIEIVLALGIVSFALAALLGLLTLGLNTSRESSEETRCSVISQYVYQELQTDSLSAEDLSSTRKSPFRPGAATATNTYYFSRDGIFLGYTYPASSKEPFFHAEARISTPDPGVYTNISAKELRSVSLVVGWPIDPSTGIPRSTARTLTNNFLLNKPLYRQSLEGAR